MIIAKKRINSVDFIEEFESKEFLIGIKVTNNELAKLNIKSFDEGLAIEPSPKFGVNCRKNTNGYSYPDKKQDKVYRYITTIEWNLKDWGGYEHSGYSDIYRYAYPRVEVAPTNIEFVLRTDENDNKYIIANFDDTYHKEKLKLIINIFLEIFGFCELFDKKYNLLKASNKIKRCNWEILPKGIKLDSLVNKKRKNKSNENKKSFEEYRFNTIESYGPNDIFYGTGGFTGYFAFVFDNICCLECNYYGNATYIIPSKGWEQISQLSKRELLISKDIIAKITHTSGWTTEFSKLMKKYY